MFDELHHSSRNWNYFRISILHYNRHIFQNGEIEWKQNT